MVQYSMNLIEKFLTTDDNKSACRKSVTKVHSAVNRKLSIDLNATVNEKT